MLYFMIGAMPKFMTGNITFLYVINLDIADLQRIFVVGSGPRYDNSKNAIKTQKK